jgi:hypothetical protein
VVDPARDCAGRMNLAAAGRLDDLLPEFADEDRPFADLRETVEHRDNVALFRRRVEAEQKVGRGQMEDVQRIRLQHLTVVHKSASFWRSGSACPRRPPCP